jgi:hypothetical protein
MSKTVVRYEIPKYFPIENGFGKSEVEVKNNSIIVTFTPQEPTLFHQVKSSYENPLLETEKTVGNEKSSRLYQLS